MIDVRHTRSLLGLAVLLSAASALAHGTHAAVPAAPEVATDPSAPREWLAGDHHVHSEFSVGWQEDGADPASPPQPILGGDARNSILRNAAMGRQFGLDWMVSTDHGGPQHSRVNAELAYPQVALVRQLVPELLLFYGMEFDTPGADHSSLIVPHTPAERDVLDHIESRYAKREPWPADPSRDSEPFMLEALAAMDALADKPVLIANHPSRSATAEGVYGLDRPAELRDWNDTAPQVAVGMEGAPGHQAAALAPDGTQRADGYRGEYRRAPTRGGFDQMTARLGGFWDSLLGEGRRFWVTATSDSHVHYSEGGSDFWPGEYAKTFVYARRDHGDILEGLREGRVFVATGGLVDGLEFVAESAGAEASLGQTLRVAPGADVTVRVRLRDPQAANAAGRDPQVARVDLIAGPITGPAADRENDRNPGTQVVARFAAQDFARDGEWIILTHRFANVTAPFYIRLRGTNGSEPEPAEDSQGEDPWADLWFYANPVFVEISPQG